LIFVKEILTHLRTIADQDKRESGPQREVAAGGRRRQIRRLPQQSMEIREFALFGSPIGFSPVDSARSSVSTPPSPGGMAGGVRRPSDQPKDSGARRVRNSIFATGQDPATTSRRGTLTFCGPTTVLECDPHSGERRIFVDPYLPIAEPTRRVQGGSAAPSEESRPIEGRSDRVRSGGSAHGP